MHLARQTDAFDCSPVGSSLIQNAMNSRLRGAPPIVWLLLRPQGPLHLHVLVRGDVGVAHGAIRHLRAVHENH